MPAYAERIISVQEALRAQGLGALVLAPTDQMKYLSGWAETGHERLISLVVPAEGDPTFIVPQMNAPQAKQNRAGIERVLGWGDSTGWHGEMANALLGVRGGIAIDDELHSVHLLAIQGIKPDSRCVAAGDLMAKLREIKTANELDCMQRSGALTDSVYEEILPTLRTGISELEVQENIAGAYRRRGTKPEFALICFGANSALPHHHTGDTTLGPGDVVIIDIGCLLDDYASDITRTVAFGDPGPDAKQVYGVVSAAHRAAFESARPGVSCESVDHAAREVIRKAEYGEYFIHRTGHGIGLSTHEPPYIVEGNKQLLREGMCFSDEPGVYLPGRFGVRIENIVTVTPGGVRYLNADPPSTLPVLQV